MTQRAVNGEDDATSKSISISLLLINWEVQ